MKKLLFTLSLASALTAPCYAQSSRQLLDDGWLFLEQDAPDAALPSFDDSRWQRVDLPHDWDIAHEPTASAPSEGGGGFYPGGIGWYRRKLSISKQPQPGKSTWLHFEGVYQHCQVYVNGQLATTHAYGYTPFKTDITALLKPGTNTISVRVDNGQQPNCRWYSGSGIYRHVWLEGYEDGKMDDPEKLFVTTEQIYGMSADGLRADSAAIAISYDGQPLEVRMLRNVNLWSPQQPALYDIKVGALTVKHGVRTFSYDADRGFILNGQPMLINGACVHHDNGVIGAMAFDAAEVRRVKLMKEAGFNLIRTSHNPQTRAMLDACDSLGMMVMDEIYDGWYARKTTYDHHLDIDSCYQEDISSMVRRDRNHPSIIAWSIGNEVIERKELRVVQTARKFKAAVTALDATRPVTEALCSWDKDWEIFDPHAEVLDIVGYNYMMHKAESDHERDPKRVMWQTESYPRDAFANWKHTVDRPYIIGDMVWTGLDYLGEASIGQWHYEGENRGEHYQGTHFPYHGAYCGDVDLTGWRKPISHYRDMLWNTPEGAPTVYMAVREPDHYTQGHISETLWSVWPTWESWNWPGWEGKAIETEIYTKAPRVALYLNDELIATRDVNLQTEYKAVVSLPYQPGTLRAVALDEHGQAVAESILRTSGAPATLRLTTDRRQIKAGGQDLAYITVEVVDKDGNLVSDAALPLTVSVSGNATLLAAASANLKDTEPKTSPRVTTYKGRAIVVVRSGKKAGKAKVSVSAEGMKKVGEVRIGN